MGKDAVLDPDTVMGGSTEVVADSTDDQDQSQQDSSKAPQEAPKSQPDIDLSKLDPAKIAELLEKDEKFREKVTKTVRQRDVEAKAETRAREIAQTQLDGMRQELDLTRGQFNRLLDQIKQARLASLPPDKQEQERAKEELVTAKQELDDLRQRLNEADNSRHRQSLLERAKEDWGLNEDDVVELEKQDTPAKFVDLALKRSSERRKELLVELETLKAKVDAQGRVQSGQSTYVATAQGASGGDIDFDEIERRWMEDHESDSPTGKYDDRYLEARQKKGYY